jgi:hypothetical protein
MHPVPIDCVCSSAFLQLVLRFDWHVAAALAHFLLQHAVSADEAHLPQLPSVQDGTQGGAQQLSCYLLWLNSLPIGSGSAEAGYRLLIPVLLSAAV